MAFLLFSVQGSVLQASAQSGELFAQVAQERLSRAGLRAPPGRVSWLLLDINSGREVASEWPESDAGIPVGSLTKPFVALAYVRDHRYFPQYYFAADPQQPRCGGRRLSIETATAYSCNSYFLAIAQDTSSVTMDNVAHDYGLPNPPSSGGARTIPRAVIGLSGSWRMRPEALARAYMQLLNDPRAEPVLAGMRLSASRGTASALRGSNMLAKTGTAPCFQRCIASGDGLVVVMSPAENPRLLLMVEEKGTTGAVVAALAARMFDSLEGAHAEH